MIKLLHTADVHLDSSFPSLGEKEELRKNDFIQTFERLLSLAIKNEVDFFLVAGDLFNSATPSSFSIGKVQSGIRRLADRGIISIILPGTHDHVSQVNSVYRRHDFSDAIVLDDPGRKDPVVVEKRGKKVCFYGAPYVSSDAGHSLAAMTRKFSEGIHVGLLHGSRKGSPEWNYRKKDLVFTLDDLKKWRLDYVALGHYHNFEIFSESNRVLACYPGSPEGKKFGENGVRHAALVRLDEHGLIVDKAAVNARTLQEQRLDLTGISDRQTVREAILSFADSNTLLRLTLEGILEFPLDMDLLQAQVCDSFFHIEMIDHTSLFDSHFAGRIADEETVRGCFVRRVQKLMAGASPDEKNLLEQAFREVLMRFKANGKGLG
ncbi:MAG: DNA repair exonuclease [Deltaproteobacteria bacterium]|nr:DNA repair exonuclease [Deltaproteobacteria bacterium]